MELIRAHDSIGRLPRETTSQISALNFRTDFTHLPLEILSKGVLPGTPHIRFRIQGWSGFSLRHSLWDNLSSYGTNATDRYLVF